MGIDHLRVPADKLTSPCDPSSLGFETTAEVSPLEGTIGQERAVSAMELGLDIDAPGFNVFISGIPGSGRNTSLRAQLERIAATKPNPPDWGYVYNFSNPSEPRAVSLPCGMMKELARDMDDLVDIVRREVPKAFESDDYSRRIEEVTRAMQERRQAITAEVEQEAQREGFALTTTQFGITPIPLREGRPMTQEEFGSLPEPLQQRIRERAERLQNAINRTMNELRRLNKEAQERSREVERELVRFTLKPIIDELQAKYASHPDVVTFLDHVEADMVEHLDILKPREETPAPLAFAGAAVPDDEVFIRYRVNPLVDNAECRGAPVIFEFSPTYYNLFGRIDYRARLGALTTDHTLIKPGVLHRANGGYLALQTRDLLLSPLSWETLKRTLRSREVRIENIGEQYSALPSATLRPQPIPVDAKIILVGSPDLMYLLQALDEDFRRYFKVAAEFDTVMERKPANIQKYAAFVAARCAEGKLRPFHKTAVAAIIEHSSRLVQHQEKLTTRFMDIADIITEANYWAGKDNSQVVMDSHVKKAVEQRRYRVSLTEERIRELIEDGTIHIATEGQLVGCVNGLSVYAIGEHSFGKPTRISARVSLGRGQVINIERETRLSGRIHDKGFMILTGYLQGKYGQDKPLSLAATIVFEQTYSEVEGDSASSTELYALLSELAEVPINQNIAVTGSVNQAGEVQAIGGVVEKIEGFFDVCRVKGLNGQQGVMVPRDNLKNLVLREDVVQAVRDGRFHIYAVSSVDEGLEVLTGVPAGQRLPDGGYPEGTLHHKVEQRLIDMARKAREFARVLDRQDGREERREGEGQPPGRPTVGPVA